MIAGKSLAPGKGSRLSFKRVEIVLYVNNPVMGLVASRVKGHPFVLIVDMHLPATNAHVDKLSHQPVGYRVTVTLVTDRRVFICPQLDLFTANHYRDRVCSKNFLLFQQERVGAFTRSLLLAPVESLQSGVKPLLCFMDRRKIIFGSEGFTAHVFNATLNMAFFVSAVEVGETVSKPVMCPELE